MAWLGGLEVGGAFPIWLQKELGFIPPNQSKPQMAEAKFQLPNRAHHISSSPLVGVDWWFGGGSNPNQSHYSKPPTKGNPTHFPNTTNKSHRRQLTWYCFKPPAREMHGRLSKFQVCSRTRVVQIPKAPVQITTTGPFRTSVVPKWVQNRRARTLGIGHKRMMQSCCPLCYVARAQDWVGEKAIKCCTPRRQLKPFAEPCSIHTVPAPSSSVPSSTSPHLKEGSL